MVDERDDRPRRRREEPSSGPETTASFGYEFGSRLAELTGTSAEEQAAVSALPSGSALLVVRRGPNIGARFLLDQDETIAGRHPSADIFLDDVTVSRDHAILVRRNDDYYLDDLGSLNGTYVNRSRIESHRLTHGDEIQIGKFRLTFSASRLDLAQVGAR